MFDILIHNARIFDGRGKPSFTGDIGILKGRIDAVGRLAGADAWLVLDAGLAAAAPGFIDAHTHSDLAFIGRPDSGAKLLQGVTTEIVGLDGLSLAPVDERNVGVWRSYLAGINGFPEIEWTWRSFADYLEKVDAARPSVNAAAYAGIGAIRLHVMGLTSRPAEKSEIERMRFLVAEAMEQGARGVSAGLIYPPNQYQSAEEIAAVASAARPYGGVFNVHLRSEGDHVLEAMDEAFSIGRTAGVPVIITHFKVTGRTNRGNADRALERFDRAEHEGVEACLEQYPYTAASTTLQSVVPPWRLEGGISGLLSSIRERREDVKREIAERDDWENWALSVGWNAIVVSSVRSERNARFVGMNVSEIAHVRGNADPADAALDLLEEEEGAVSMVMHCMDEADVTTIMRHPATAIITDGILGGGKPHPRVFGSFPRVLGRYVREMKTIGIEDAVRKMTSLSAGRLRLPRKGLIQPGCDADIVVFDPETIADTGTYENPESPPRGIRWVIVNGVLAVDDGRLTGAAEGKTIRER